MVIFNSGKTLTKEEAIYQIAKEQIKYEIALEKGYSVSDSEIDSYINNFLASISGANGEKEYREFIASYGKSELEYRNDVKEPLRNALTVGKMMNEYRTQTVQGDSIIFTADTLGIDAIVEQRLQQENIKIY